MNIRYYTIWVHVEHFLYIIKLNGNSVLHQLGTPKNFLQDYCIREIGYCTNWVHLKYFMKGYQLFKFKLGTNPIRYICNTFYWTSISVGNWVEQQLGTFTKLHTKGTNGVKIRYYTIWVHLEHFLHNIWSNGNWVLHQLGTPKIIPTGFSY